MIGEIEAGFGLIARGRRAVRNVLVLIVSVAVVASLVAYVLSPTSYRFSISIEESSPIASNVATAVVYGRVTDGDDGLPGVSIAASRGRQVLGSTVSSADGTYRLELRPGEYEVRFACQCDGHDVNGSRSLTARAQRAYRIDAELTAERSFFVTPVSSY